MIKDRENWSTWVLVDSINPEMWYNMNTNKKIIEDILDNHSWMSNYAMVLARWDYYRDPDKGDILTQKTTFFPERTMISTVNYEYLPYDAVYQIANVFKRYAAYALDAFDTVRICNDGKNNMVATFSQSKGDGKFTMGAVWSEKERIFTYHS